MPDTTTTIIAVVLVFIMIVVAWLELSYLRKRSKSRRARSERRPEDLRDETHNALITTRAIATTLAERGGVRSDEVDEMLREAQMAYDRRNYRVALDLATRIKEHLVSLKGQQAARGDAARLNTLSSGPASDEPTTKEVLTKQYAPNMIPSKFAMSVAETSIEQGAVSGRDVSQARSLLAAARSRFDAQDYAGALSVARQAERTAKGETVAVPAPVAAAVPASTPTPSAAAAPSARGAAALVGSVCPSCGASMKSDDVFCRKCGARVVLTNCPSCGAPLLADDAFCRKCGTRLQR